MWRCVSLRRSFHYWDVLLHDRGWNVAPDVVLIAIVTGDLVNGIPEKAQFGFGGGGSCSWCIYAPWCCARESALLSVYDLCATRTGMPSFRKMLVILWLRRSQIYGILRYDQSTLGGGEFLWWLWGCFVCSVLSSGYPFMRRMSSNTFRCFMDVCVEHLSSIRFHSLRMKLIFDFLGMADWWCTNSGFLAVFFVKLEGASAVFGDGDFKID